MSSLEDIFSGYFSAGHSLIELQNQGYWGRKELLFLGSPYLFICVPKDSTHSILSDLSFLLVIGPATIIP